MVYVLDSNILATSRRTHFPLEEKTGFWELLVDLGKKRMIIIPERVFEEIGKGNDELPDWLAKNKFLFWKPTSSCRHKLTHVIQAYESIWEGVPSESQISSWVPIPISLPMH